MLPEAHTHRLIATHHGVLMLERSDPALNARQPLANSLPLLVAGIHQIPVKNRAREEVGGRDVERKEGWICDGKQCWCEFNMNTHLTPSHYIANTPNTWQ